MSGYRLCYAKKATVPYYIENISMNIYTLEELCYYFQHNVYLLDETIINEGLCDWIRDELGLRPLYARLYRELDRSGSVGDFILPIFKEIKYLTHEEFKELNNILLKLEQEPDVSRRKLKGDYLVEHGKYINALKVYKSALAEAKENKLGAQFMGEVYRNMGCAHMRMFQYEEALGCLKTASESVRSTGALRDYLTAYYLARPREKYMEEGTNLGASEKLLKEIEDGVLMVKESVSRPDETEILEDYLAQLTSGYHNSTGL